MAKNTINEKPAIDPRVGMGSLEDVEKKSPSDVVRGVFEGLFKKVVLKDGVKNEKKDNSTKNKEPEYEGQQTEKLFQVGDLTRNLTPKKILKMALFILMAFMIVAALYVRVFQKTPIKKSPIIVNQPTPSYSPYQKYKPSIYAEDPNFKNLEEDIAVLETEISNTSLEDKALLPPTLDFDVVFK